MREMSMMGMTQIIAQANTERTSTRNTLQVNIKKNQMRLAVD